MAKFGDGGEDRAPKQKAYSCSDVAQKQLLQISCRTLGNPGGNANRDHKWEVGCPRRGTPEGLQRVVGAGFIDFLPQRLFSVVGDTPVVAASWRLPTLPLSSTVSGVGVAKLSCLGDHNVGLAGLAGGTGHPSFPSGHPHVPLSRTAVMAAPSPGSASLVNDQPHQGPASSGHVGPEVPFEASAPACPVCLGLTPGSAHRSERTDRPVHQAADGEDADKEAGEIMALFFLLGGHGRWVPAMPRRKHVSGCVTCPLSVPL